jgi:serine protease Do
VRGLGVVCDAEIIAADPRSDLAVLKLLDTPPGLTAVELADVRINEGPRKEKPTLAKGAWVVALGHPTPGGAADGGASASWGIVGNLRRRQVGPAREDQRVRPLSQHTVLIQTDARVTLGCSGGGLFNLDGKLVGLTTPLAAVTGAETSGGYAIPMDPNYRRIVDALKAGREVEYGFLGVTVAQDPGARLENGLPLMSVAPGTPAWQAGLRGSQQGFRDGADSILAVDGNPIREQDDLFLYVGAALAGTKVTLTVSRPGQGTRQVPVTLAKYSHGLPWLAAVRPRPVHGLRVEYSSVMALQWSGSGQPPVGVVVREVDPNTPAEAVLKRLGGEPTRWMITHVNDRPVTAPAEFYEAARKGGSVHLRLVDPNARPDDRAVHDVTLP